jgi:hypothetical protein
MLRNTLLCRTGRAFSTTCRRSRRMQSTPGFRTCTSMLRSVEPCPKRNQTIPWCTWGLRALAQPNPWTRPTLQQVCRHSSPLHLILFFLQLEGTVRMDFFGTPAWCLHRSQYVVPVSHTLDSTGMRMAPWPRPGMGIIMDISWWMNGPCPLVWPFALLVFVLFCVETRTAALLAPC